VVSRSPIVIEDLTKRYSREVLAVDRLNLTVEPGSVFGMLGPNGAGKTTTMRMLVGLIHPSSGQVRLFGEAVRSGARVLRRVGVLVDSPGFVPHLSGRRNLELFWRAGGAPMSESNLERALELAALGSAIDRKFKTYSQGMRQRLGLAQALLGRPDLLILDEPTNGLDPQQTRDVRAVIREAAAGGTTVLLSSHLLSEVEQLCDHVAVVNHGRLVAHGAVAELVGAATTVSLEVDDVTRACAVLGEMRGVRSLHVHVTGISLELEGLARKDVVAALVHAEVGVETITARHQLEDAFIGLLNGAGEPDGAGEQ
jgi:ABC-2 type transport system ATP-binding protein